MKSGFNEVYQERAPKDHARVRGLGDIIHRRGAGVAACPVCRPRLPRKAKGQTTIFDKGYCLPASLSTRRAVNALDTVLEMT